ncbi:FkbM family methyltransferase [bacterium]|nr:FkbM family methyltransferase [bacterium]
MSDSPLERWRSGVERAGLAPQRLGPLVTAVRRLTWPIVRPYFLFVLDRLEEVRAGSASGSAVPVGGGHARPSYSQSGEDLIIEFVLERLEVSPAVTRYADVGAATPDGHNNTYLLYTKGARGLLVEADPAYRDVYAEVRPGDEVLSAAVVPERLRGGGSIEFHLAGDRGWNSVLREHVEEAERRGKGGVVRTLTAPTRTINEALARFEGAELHVLSIDVEGVDHELVGELDFARVRPWIVVVEDAGRGELDGILTDRGYVRYAGTYINAIYLDRPVLDRLVTRF